MSNIFLLKLIHQAVARVLSICLPGRQACRTSFVRGGGGLSTLARIVSSAFARKFPHEKFAWGGGGCKHLRLFMLFLSAKVVCTHLLEFMVKLFFKPGTLFALVFMGRPTCHLDSALTRE